MLNPRTNNLTVLLSQMQVGQRHTTLYFGCLVKLPKVAPYGMKQL